MQSKKGYICFKYLVDEARKQGFGVSTAVKEAGKNRQITFITERTEGAASGASGRRMMILGTNIYGDISAPAKYITKRKFLTYELLKKFGVKMPKTFMVKTCEEFSRVVNENFDGKKFVVKPENRGLGKDVYIVDDQDLADKICQVMLPKYAKKGVVIQDFAEGSDLRIQAVGGKLFAACVRVPANVVGDGRSTILQLVAAKNKQKAKLSKAALIILDEEVESFLKDQELNLKSVLEEGRNVKLRKIANIGVGGEPIDVTEKVHRDFYDLVELIADLMKMKTFAVDMICVDPERGMVGRNAAMIEINAPCMWAHNHFMHGQKRNVALAILDAYFHKESFDPKDAKYLLK